MRLSNADAPALRDCRRVYIAGPMTGIADFNYPAFNEAAEALRAVGYEVESPAENEGGDFKHPYDWYLRRAIAKLITCDGMALLDGWEASRGARLEVGIAQECSIRIAPIDTWREFKPS